MKSFSFSCILAVLLSVAAAEINAQATRSLSNLGRRLDEFNKQNDKVARDEMNREMNGRKPSKEELQRAARIKSETKEDLEALQTEYNEIALKLNARVKIEDSFVRNITGSIHKHASRLHSNMVFPKPEENEVRAPSKSVQADVRLQLKDLCSRIFDFLTNPMIENPNIIDISSAKSARLSLESVIEISNRIREPFN
ncbi:MAG: hypothetical protein ACT4O9_09370 [Blastocatellia bacterium]